MQSYNAKLKISITALAIFGFLFLGYNLIFASETSGTIIVDGPNAGYAWSDQAGWINFGCANCGISITDSGITGNAWSENYGWINMSPSNGGVLVAANGALSGNAWGEGLGWINFSGVSINSSGTFVGQATGTLIGTLIFDCANCDVRTDYRAQDFRTPAPPPAPPSSRGGGGGIIFQLTPSPISTQKPSGEPITETEIPGIEIGPPGERAETPGEGFPSTEITSPVVSEAEPEENPPLFDIQVSPGPLESKRTRALIFFAIAIVIAAVIIFLLLKKRREDEENQQ